MQNVQGQGTEPRIHLYTTNIINLYKRGKTEQTTTTAVRDREGINNNNHQ